MEDKSNKRKPETEIDRVPRRQLFCDCPLCDLLRLRNGAVIGLLETKERLKKCEVMDQHWYELDQLVYNYNVQIQGLEFELYNMFASTLL